MCGGSRPIDRGAVPSGRVPGYGLGLRAKGLFSQAPFPCLGSHALAPQRPSFFLGRVPSRVPAWPTAVRGQRRNLRFCLRTFVSAARSLPPLAVWPNLRRSRASCPSAGALRSHDVVLPRSRETRSSRRSTASLVQLRTRDLGAHLLESRLHQNSYLL